MTATFPTDAQITEQAAADAEAYARIQFDYDPASFFHLCEEHHNEFLTHCVICPEDHGNGRESDAARMAREARAAQDLAQRFGADVPF